MQPNFYNRYNGYNNRRINYSPFYQNPYQIKYQNPYNYADTTTTTTENANTNLNNKNTENLKNNDNDNNKETKENLKNNEKVENQKAEKAAKKSQNTSSENSDDKSQDRLSIFGFNFDVEDLFILGIALFLIYEDSCDPVLIIILFLLFIDNKFNFLGLNNIFDNLGNLSGFLN